MHDFNKNISDNNVFNHSHHKDHDNLFPLHHNGGFTGEESLELNKNEPRETKDHDGLDGYSPSKEDDGSPLGDSEELDPKYLANGYYHQKGEFVQSQETSEQPNGNYFQGGLMGKPGVKNGQKLKPDYSHKKNLKNLLDYDIRLTNDKIESNYIQQDYQVLANEQKFGAHGMYNSHANPKLHQNH